MKDRKNEGRKERKKEGPKRKKQTRKTRRKKSKNRRRTKERKKKQCKNKQKHAKERKLPFLFIAPPLCIVSSLPCLARHIGCLRVRHVDRKGPGLIRSVLARWPGTKLSMHQCRSTRIACCAQAEFGHMGLAAIAACGIELGLLNRRFPACPPHAYWPTSQTRFGLILATHVGPYIYVSDLILDVMIFWLPLDLIVKHNKHGLCGFRTDVILQP